MLKKLKSLLSLNKIDGYIIPKNDEYFSEYSFPDRLRYITKFSGSAGIAIILQNENLLFIDGRYTIQAKKESGKNFKIYEISKFKPYSILNKFGQNLKLGYDPKLFTELSIKKNFKKDLELVPINFNLIDKLFFYKKNNNTKYFYKLEDKISGKNITSKVKNVILKIKKKKIDNLFISSNENCAWLTNIRGHDQPHSPIPNCKIILTKKGKIYFFSNPKKIKNIKKLINYGKIEFFNIDQFYYVISKLEGKSFCIDENSCSIFFKNLILSKFNISCYNDPCEYLKSIKNKTEISNIIKSHIEDGVALTKFLYWIKKENKKPITELDAIKKLDKFRKLSPNYLYPSFKTISGTGPNSAIIHYNVNKQTERKIKKKDIYLCDSGGQYKYGTTDVTRTICFDKPNIMIKEIFTRVLKGHIAVVNSNLKRDNIGSKIDKKARKSLKEINLDYNHGTGHGVGYFLNVHEGPQSISKYNKVRIQPGMIISNEPGYYKYNSYGIRIENLIYVKRVNRKSIFKNLTLAPIDNDLIDFQMLTKKEKNYLKNYHTEVYKKLAMFLSFKEKKWLRELIQ